MTQPGTPILPAFCSCVCATHRCNKPCGRNLDHPEDFVKHICDGCAQLMAGVRL